MKHITAVLIGCLLLASLAHADDPIKFYASRDTMIPEAHKMNNDGGWGYGWIKVSQGAHNYGLLGFDVSALLSTDPETVLDPQADIVSAKIRLRVAQNHFAEDGQEYYVYEWNTSESNPIEDWVEGYNRFDLFTYCSQSQWSRPAAQNDPQVPSGYAFGEGATWSCSNDLDTEDGSTACPAPTPNPAYDWDVDPADGVHLGFSLPATPLPVASPIASFVGKKRYNDTDPQQAVYCGDLAADIKRDCDPLCAKSIACFQNGIGSNPVQTPNPAWGTADKCYRTVEIDVTDSLRHLVDEGVSDVSWLIRRKTNSGAGAFHYFSREGAVCVMGACGTITQPDYRELMPLLVVQLATGVSPPSPTSTPVLECWKSYPGRCASPTPTP